MVISNPEAFSDTLQKVGSARVLTHLAPTLRLITVALILGRAALLLL